MFLVLRFFSGVLLFFFRGLFRCCISLLFATHSGIHGRFRFRRRSCFVSSGVEIDRRSRSGRGGFVTGGASLRYRSGGNQCEGKYSKNRSE